METTVSFRTDHTLSRLHNIRYEPMVENEAHIDLDRPHETWRDMDEKTAYEFLFGNAVREYNEKQTREDRRIKDYLTDVQNDKRGRKNKRTNESSKHSSYEVIIQIGNAGYELNEDGIRNADDDGNLIMPNLIDEAIGHEIMKKYVDTWEERNPNLFLYGAYYHADEEGAPHVHLDFIPVATGYTRGMSKQSSIGRALKQQGYDDNDSWTHNAYTLWQEHERGVLESMCHEHGFTIKHPCKGKKIKHLDTPEYKALGELNVEYAEKQEEFKQLCQQVKELKGEVAENENLKELNASLDNRYEKKLKVFENLSKSYSDMLNTVSFYNHARNTIDFTKEIDRIYQASTANQDEEMAEFLRSLNIRQKDGTTITAYAQYQQRLENSVKSDVNKAETKLNNFKEFEKQLKPKIKRVEDNEVDAPKMPDNDWEMEK